MIWIPQDIHRAIIDHARHDLPDEACGYLAGIDNKVMAFYPLTNIDHSPEHFSFDPSEQFLAVKDARQKGYTILANYHSHPKTPARPSAEDIRLSFDPDISYVIISLAGSTPVVHSFRIQNGYVFKEDISIQ